MLAVVYFCVPFRDQDDSKLELTIIIDMEEFENPKTTSWLDFLTKGEPEDIDESEKRYLFPVSG